MWKQLVDWMSNHPLIDFGVAAMAVVGWLAIGGPCLQADVAAPALTGLASLAGISFALVSVVLAFIHRPGGEYVKSVMAKYGRVLHRATLAPMFALLIAALAPTFAAAIYPAYPALATGSGVLSGALTTVTLLRLLWILHVVMGMHDRGAAEDEREVAAPPNAKF
ncbi:hypothetical protein [Nesterenkonia sandarakina]|uniref:Uncharacterized protein n=1 Tax=Nesterenkonia sandarakina TaxID=272918 RepID=A0A2T0YJ40_9MICC|nr:hypothetical protein [Nesterenkonia sandarakina]PRZ15188.1 hypothetical protein BCL67_109109 [Nesterenkonia sandarakina]